MAQTPSGTINLYRASIVPLAITALGSLVAGIIVAYRSGWPPLQPPLTYVPVAWLLTLQVLTIFAFGIAMLTFLYEYADSFVRQASILNRVLEALLVILILLSCNLAASDVWLFRFVGLVEAILWLCRCWLALRFPGDSSADELEAFAQARRAYFPVLFILFGLSSLDLTLRLAAPQLTPIGLDEFLSDLIFTAGPFFISIWAIYRGTTPRPVPRQVNDDHEVA